MYNVHNISSSILLKKLKKLLQKYEVIDFLFNTE